MNILKYIKYILILIPINLLATNYYVADTSVTATASNTNAGTDINNPWFSWQKAFSTAEAGDTVFFRAGVWYPDDDVTPVVNFEPPSNGNDGTYANPIVFMLWPADSEINNGYATLDCRNCYSGGTFAGIRIRGAEYIEFHDLEIRNLWARGGGFTTNEINLQNSTHVTFNHCSFHDGSEAGFSGTSTDTLILRNCDAYNHCDTSEVGGGTDADGFIIGTGSDAGENLHYYLSVRGCRAWNNSDDQFDISHTKNVYVDSCWAFWGGILYDEDLQGDGSGFKFGATDSMLHEEHHRVTRCISTYNYNKGFEINNAEANGHAIYWSWYNNTIYKCRAGFSSACGGASVCWTYANDSGYVDVTNNLIYEWTHDPGPLETYLTQWGSTNPRLWVNPTTDSWIFDPESESPHWDESIYNPAYTITDADFTDLDSATIFSELSGTRKVDGSLPDITVLKLASNSDLINEGTDVGLSYIGEGPDLGAFEFGADEGQSGAHAITGFTFPNQRVASVIDTTNHTVLAVVGGTKTNIAPTISQNGASIDPASGVARDFTTPQTYTVTSVSEDEVVYTVTVIARNLLTSPEGKRYIMPDGTFLQLDE